MDTSPDGDFRRRDISFLWTFHSLTFLPMDISSRNISLPENVKMHI